MFYDAVPKRGGVEIAFNCLRGECGTRKINISSYSQPPMLVNKF